MTATRFSPALLALVTLVQVAAQPASAAFLTNLIVNGNAEAGAGSVTGNDIEPVPSWTTVGNFTVVQYGIGGGFPSTTDPGPASRGSNYFSGGPENASSSASQLINEAADAALIDTGGVTFTLSGFLGGFDIQGDNAKLTATFLSASSTTLGSSSIGPVSAADRSGLTGMLERTATGSLPIGTRTIQVSLQMTRTDGAYNDGYADNLSLVLTAPNAAVPEPSSLVMFGAGALGLAFLRSRQRRTVTE